MRAQNFFLLALFQLIALLPLSVLRKLGEWIGYTMWRLNGREARVTRKNLELCFPEMESDQRENLVRESLKHTAQTALELIKIWVQPNERSERLLVEIENPEILEQKLRSPNGVLMLVPHLGNWEIVGLWCARYGEAVALYQPPKQAVLDPIIWRARERLGNKLYPTDRSGVRALLKALKKGGFTAVLPDQAPDAEGGVFQPFFGVPTLTMTLVHGLASRTGCELLMVFGQRVDGGFRIVCREADPLIKSPDINVSAAALNRSVEHCIEECPEQYQWEYKRFKKQPDGKTKHYKF